MEVFTTCGAGECGAGEDEEEREEERERWEGDGVEGEKRRRKREREMGRRWSRGREEEEEEKVERGKKRGRVEGGCRKEKEQGGVRQPLQLVPHIVIHTRLQTGILPSLQMDTTVTYEGEGSRHTSFLTVNRGLHSLLLFPSI